MRLLSGSYQTEGGLRAPSLLWPVMEITVLTALGVGLGLAGAALTAAWRGMGHALAGASVHAGFLAIGWVLALDGHGSWRVPALHGGAALLLAAVAVGLTPGGALAYLLVPFVFARDAGRQRGRLERVGWRPPREPRAMLIGAAAGTFLGLHLLLAASLTLGYTVSAPGGSRYLAALAYDVGANALTAEWLFRGAIFSALWRRWSFWPAAALSSGCGLARYLLDPALPHALEAMAGATFYLSLLSVGCCALRAWSGSLAPGYLATVGFFAAYRMLHS